MNKIFSFASQLDTLLLWLLLIVVAPTIKGEAQEAKVLTSVEPTAIRIGEQSIMTVRVVHPSKDSIALALPSEGLVPGVEILGVSKAERHKINEKLQESIYKVVLTSFDSAMYVLDNVKAIVAGQEITSQDHPKLIVNTVDVDLAHPEKIKEIKPQAKTPWVWADYIVYPYLLFGCLLLLFLGYVVFQWYRWRKEKSQRGESPITKEPLDPYIEAVNAIEELRKREQWKTLPPKVYYTELTDILRRYLYRAWEVPTLDKTSAEILETFRSLQRQQPEVYETLRKILTTADLVKFAKYKPSVDDNLSLLNASATFVQENKPQEEKGEES